MNGNGPTGFRPPPLEPRSGRSTSNEPFFLVRRQGNVPSESDELGEQREGGRDANAIGDKVLPADRTQLPGGNRRESAPEITQPPVDVLIAPLGLDHQDRLSPFDDDEVDLSAVGVPEVSQFEVPAFDVLLKVNPLEKM